MVYGTRRLPPFGSGWMLHLPMHFAISLGVGMLHTTLTSLARTALIELPGLGVGDYSLTANRYLLSLPNQLIVYAVVVGITMVVDRYRAARNRELEAAELKSRLTESQLESLRRQLEPHFLMTTLNTISELIYTSPKVGGRNDSRLNALLRHAFAPDQEHETTPQRAAHARSVLDMMRLRFADGCSADRRAESCTRLSCTSDSAPLARMRSKQRGAGEFVVAVRVSARRESDDRYPVRDRGPVATVGAQPRTGQCGERIAHLYGTGYGITLAEADECGAEVRSGYPCVSRRVAAA